MRKHKWIETQEENFKPMFSTSATTLVSAHWTVKLNDLNVTDENHKKCIFPIFTSKCSAVLLTSREVSPEKNIGFRGVKISFAMLPSRAVNNYYILLNVNEIHRLYKTIQVK